MRKKKNKILLIIPARMSSTRFPGKPLKKINGKEMIGHVYDNCKMEKNIDVIAVATCDIEIKQYIDKLGGYCVMTSKKHERASDRCAEALKKIEKNYRMKFDIVIMVQGDEPLVTSKMIKQAYTPLVNNKKILISNLLGKIRDNSEHKDKNCIKVVCDKFGDALYFSRQPIPNIQNVTSSYYGKQVCIIPFRRDFLLKYTTLKPTILEKKESIDMLRVLEHGFKVKMIPTNHTSLPVDTKYDLKKVEKFLQTKSKKK